jgi:hypothetical protein
MPPVTASKTVTAIVERSLPLVAPFGGTLALVRGKDGRYRLGERLMDGIASIGVWPRDAQGHRLPAGHALSRAEAERAVRTLMGLDQKAPRQRVQPVSSHASV